MYSNKKQLNIMESKNHIDKFSEDIRVKDFGKYEILT